MTEAARGVGDDASHIYLVKDKGFKPVVAFKEAQDKGHNGYAGQLQQAFVKGIIEPISQWHKDVSALLDFCRTREWQAAHRSAFVVMVFRKHVLLYRPQWLTALPPPSITLFA